VLRATLPAFTLVSSQAKESGTDQTREEEHENEDHEGTRALEAESLRSVPATCCRIYTLLRAEHAFLHGMRFSDQCSTELEGRRGSACVFELTTFRLCRPYTQHVGFGIRGPQHLVSTCLQINLQIPAVGHYH
jgi:hypothetical protein